MSGRNAGTYFKAEISRSVNNVLTKANFIQFLKEKYNKNCN